MEIKANILKLKVFETNIYFVKMLSQNQQLAKIIIINIIKI